MLDWKEQALKLRIGQSLKVPCCGNSASAYISNSAQGIRFGPCFRCDRKDFVPHKGLSFAERRAMRQREDDLIRERKMHKGAVPFTQAPPDAHAWVLKSGLSIEEATSSYGFKWNDYIQRILIPVGDGHIGRSLTKGQPKYISDTATLWRSNCGTDRVHVLVEDVLSAIKVSRAGYGAVALMGTSQDALKMIPLLQGSSLIIGWFDPDAAGQEGLRKARKACGLVDAPFKSLRTDVDPKLVPLARMKDLIEKIKETTCST